MRIRIAAVLLACMGLVACRNGAEGLGIHLKMDQRRLSNGLQVIMVPDRTVPIVSYQTWLRTGSVDEDTSSLGISHLLEHLMFKGAEKYGPKQFFLQLEAKGAEVNAFTTRDYTAYVESFTPDLLEKVIDMEADRLRSLRVDDSVVRGEVAVVLEERKLRTDNSPEGRMQEALWALAFRLHPYRWPISGIPETLVTMNAEKVKAYMARHYSAANAIIVITGAFDPDRAFELIRKAYGQMPRREVVERAVPEEPEQKEERRLVLYDGTASERFLQAYHITSAKDDDSFALDVLANILFEGTSSRMYRRLVEDRDIAIGVSGSAYTPAHPGLFLISGVMRNGIPASRAEAELDAVIRDVQENGVSEQEVKAAVRQLTVQLVDSVRTPGGLGQLIGVSAVVLGDPERFADDLAKYTKVSSEDVKRVAGKYLVPNNRSIVTLLPEAQKQKAKGQVKEGKSAP